MNRAPYLPLLVAAPLFLGSAAPPDLSGRWARVEVTTALTDVPVLGGLTAETTSLALLEVMRDGDGYRVKAKVCAIENQSVGGMVRTRFPPAFLAALSGGSTPAKLVPSAEGLRYVEERPYRVRGARLRDTAQEALPTRPDDPRLEDTDKDGQPGLTVRVEGFVEGDVYVVQRDKSALAGLLRDGRRIEGLVRWDAEQRVLGASRSMLETTPDSRPHPEPAKSWFRMRRVPASATCSELVRRAPRLFGLKADD